MALSYDKKTTLLRGIETDMYSSGGIFSEDGSICLNNPLIREYCKNFGATAYEVILDDLSADYDLDILKRFASFIGFVDQFQLYPISGIEEIAYSGSDLAMQIYTALMRIREDSKGYRGTAFIFPHHDDLLNSTAKLSCYTIFKIIGESLNGPLEYCKEEEAIESRLKTLDFFLQNKTYGSAESIAISGAFAGLCKGKQTLLIEAFFKRWPLTVKEYYFNLVAVGDVNMYKQFPLLPCFNGVEKSVFATEEDKNSPYSDLNLLANICAGYSCSIPMVKHVMSLNKDREAYQTEIMWGVILSGSESFYRKYLSVIGTGSIDRDILFSVIPSPKLLDNETAMSMLYKDIFLSSIPPYKSRESTFFRDTFSKILRRIISSCSSGFSAMVVKRRLLGENVNYMLISLMADSKELVMMAREATNVCKVLADFPWILNTPEAKKTFCSICNIFYADMRYICYFVLSTQESRMFHDFPHPKNRELFNSLLEKVFSLSDEEKFDLLVFLETETHLHTLLGELPKEKVTYASVKLSEKLSEETKLLVPVASSTDEVPICSEEKRYIMNSDIVREIVIRDNSRRNIDISSYSLEVVGELLLRAGNRQFFYPSEDKEHEYYKAVENCVDVFIKNKGKVTAKETSASSASNILIGRQTSASSASSASNILIGNQTTASSGTTNFPSSVNVRITFPPGGYPLPPVPGRAPFMTVPPVPGRAPFFTAPPVITVHPFPGIRVPSSKKTHKDDADDGDDAEFNKYDEDDEKDFL